MQRKEVQTPMYGKRVEHLKSIIKSCGIGLVINFEFLNRLIPCTFLIMFSSISFEVNANWQVFSSSTVFLPRFTRESSRCLKINVKPG